MGNNIVDSYANLNAATGPDSCYGPVRKMGNRLFGSERGVGVR